MKITRRQFLLGSAGLSAGVIGLSWLNRRKVPSVPSPPMDVNLPNNKRISLLFQFGEHESTDEARTIEPLLRDFKPHAVCIEAAFASPRSAKETEEVYMGKFEGEGTPFQEALRAAFLKYPSRVFSLERKFSQADSEKLNNEWLTNRFASGNAVMAFYFGNHEDAIKTYRKVLETNARLAVVREKAIHEVISNLHAELLKKFPELEKERQLRVLVRYGSQHTPIYAHALSSDFGQVSRNIDKPYYYPPEAVHQRLTTFRELRHGNHPKVKNADINVAQTLLGEVLAEYARRLGVSFSNGSAFGNLFSRKITLKHFRRISRKINGKALLYQEEADAALVREFEKEGMPLPKTKEGVHRFLRNQKIPLAAV